MTSTRNVVVAFSLTILAGISTMIGAAAPYFPSRFQNSPLGLAGALGFAAGVMIYVSFVDIFAGKTLDAFEEAEGVGPEFAHTVGGLFFFAGMGAIASLNALTHRCGAEAFDHSELVMPPAGGRVGGSPGPHSSHWSHDGITYVDQLSSGHAASLLDESYESESYDGTYDEEEEEDSAATTDCESGGVSTQDPGLEKELFRMSMRTLVAVAVHNVFDGLAVFVSALADGRAGVAVAFAIAVHNAPEGALLALPIYHASGSKARGFWYGSFSGFTEPIGALVGYAILRDSESPWAYGIMFGLVSGMMVFISVRELLPYARRYDPDDRVSTWSCVVGMFVMAVSLALFDLS